MLGISILLQLLVKINSAYLKKKVDKLKDFGVSFCMTILGSLSFIIIKWLPFLTETLGFGGTYYFFSGVCVLSVIFNIFCMPETKEKSYDEIMKSLQ